MPRFVTTKQALYPLRYRPRTSDLRVFHQIFIECEYDCLSDICSPGLVLDCGANVGYSSAYFLSRHPGCRVIAVEPFDSNFALLCQNMAPYGSSVHCVHAAIWSENTRLSMGSEPILGEEWAQQVAEFSRGRADLAAFDIPHLLSASGEPRVSILKMDIEGAEACVFKHGCDWLSQIDNIVIELHTNTVFGNGKEAFLNAIAAENFDVSTWGELTVCKRRHL